MTTPVAGETTDTTGTTAASLRAVLDSAGALIVCTDADFRITEFNPAAERAFGRRRDDVLGCRYSDLMPAVVRGKIDRDCARVLAGDAIDQFENTISDADGHITVLLWDVRCLRDADGRAHGIVGIAQDITARLGAEASIERRKRELQTLTSLHRALIGLSDPEPMAVSALDHLQQLVSCTGAAVYQLTDDDAEPRILATAGTPPAALPTTHGADTDEEADVVLPLVGGDTQFGLLYVAFTPDQDLSPSQRVGVAAQVADRLAAALHAARISESS